MRAVLGEYKHKRYDPIAIGSIADTQNSGFGREISNLQEFYTGTRGAERKGAVFINSKSYGKDN